MFVKIGKGRLALGFVYHPHGAGVFLVPASKIKLETREKPWPFFELNEATIMEVTQIGLDRIFDISVDCDGRELHIVCEALGPNGNLWLVDSDSNIKASLRKRAHKVGFHYSPPPPLDGLSPLSITAEQLRMLFDSHPDSKPQYLLEKNVLGLNRILAAETLYRAAMPSEGLSDEDISSLASTIADLAVRFVDTASGYLYSMGKRLEAYPFKLSGWDEQPEKFKSLSLAVMAMCVRRQSQTEEVDERKVTMQIVNRAIKRLKTRLEKIANDIAKASDFDNYRRKGELLQINFNRLKKGMTEISVDDVYNEGQQTITIMLNPALTPAKNVEHYFHQHRKGREGLDIMKRRQEISHQELEKLEQMYSKLGNNYEAACAQYEAELSVMKPHTTERAKISERLPFRKFTLSTGLTIFVGRDGADNDRTSFEYGKPYETWLHVQQSPGSHVVIKYPNKSFEPSKSEIEESAAIAAWFSKARHDNLVPVIYTQRKYVRKPRKAKPGLVTVEREKSVMVTPRKPE